MIRPAHGPWLAVVALLAATPGLAAAGPLEPGGPEAKTGLLKRQTEGRPKLDYYLYVPVGFERAKRYGLVVVLHAAGVHGARFTLQWGVLAERAGDYIVLGPECQDRKRRVWKFGDEGHVIATVRKVVADYNIDGRRILLTGFSQGAVYTYTFGLRNPGVFRALAPFSGALFVRSPAALEILKRARGLPVYIVHGAADAAIPTARGRAARDRLEEAGCRVVYREIPQFGHRFAPMEAGRVLKWFGQLAAEPATPPKPAAQPGD